MGNQSYPGVVAPPAGVTPDIHRRDSGAKLLLAWLIICNVLVLVFFLVRAYAQVIVRRRFLVEDGTYLGPDLHKDEVGC